jgi:ADP-heptose:LPS heptosyltransferase
MHQVNQASIVKSISPTNNQTDGKVDIENNTGIRNSVSAIKGKEESEAILEAIYNFDIEHAVEFAQRELNDYMRWWDRMAQKNWAANIDMQKSYQNSAITASFVTGGITGFSNTIAGLAQKNTNNNNVSKLTQEEKKETEPQEQREQRLTAQNEKPEANFGVPEEESQVFS